MARKPWGELSEPYRKRLERGGITPEQHRSGIPLKKARGHAPKTGPIGDKFPTSITRRVQAKKQTLFGSSPKFNRTRSNKNVLINPKTKRPPSQNTFNRFLSDDFELSSDLYDDDEWAWLFYH
jgi:hypothetical protein